MLGFPRREFPMKLAFTTAVAAGCLFAVTAYAQQDFSKVEIKTTPLGNNVYMLEGQGGNVVAAVGQDGVIQVDGEFAPLHDKIKAEVDKLCGGKPINISSTRISMATTRAVMVRSIATAPRSCRTR